MAALSEPPRKEFFAMRHYEFVVRPSMGEFHVLCVDGESQRATTVFSGTKSECWNMLGRLSRAEEVLRLAFAGELKAQLEVVAL